MKKLLLAAILACASPCFALLSPLNQSIEEIQSILQSTDLQKYLSQSQAISKIIQYEKGYLLVTDQVQMQVEIQYIPTDRPGRQQFKLIFHAPTPLTRR